MRPTHALSLLAVAALTLTATPALADLPPPAARSVYRIDVSITGIDTSAHPAPATYTLVLEEGQTGALSTGANVPLVAGTTGGAAPRQDVGLSLRFSYTLRGTVVLLDGGVELSAIDPGQSGGPVTIHRIRADGVVPVHPGTPSLFGSVYDPVSGRRYEITISASRLL